MQAALAVLARRDCSGETLGQRLNLTATDLRGADLEYAQLQRADFTGANLKGARLGGAFMDSAILEGANLVDARLVGTHLVEARLRGAGLAGAKLWDAQLRGADLQAANLDGAFLGGADLSSARLWDAKLQGTDLQGAILDGAMGLPEGQEPARLKEPVKATQMAHPPAPITSSAPAKLPAVSPITGRRSQTMVYLNGIAHGRRRGGSNSSKDGVEDVPKAELEPVSWGTGDEDS
ncbi:MAG: pentapeptide repeat-containing protein [Dehalococcoidia bacterium]|nr:pentapeptide repeat-containing protein [Dehalococcoidia bacterium]MSQ17890.1 pentapeptide repeat-containing protein [Dehalococcoidia bacterium]